MTLPVEWVQTVQHLDASRPRRSWGQRSTFLEFFDADDVEDFSPSTQLASSRTYATSANDSFRPLRRSHSADPSPRSRGQAELPIKPCSPSWHVGSSTFLASAEGEPPAAAEPTAAAGKGARKGNRKALAGGLQHACFKAVSEDYQQPAPSRRGGGARAARTRQHQERVYQQGPALATTARTGSCDASSMARVNGQKMQLQDTASSQCPSPWLSAPPATSAGFRGLSGGAFLAGGNNRNTTHGAAADEQQSPLEGSSGPGSKQHKQNKKKKKAPKAVNAPYGRETTTLVVHQSFQTTNSKPHTVVQSSLQCQAEPPHWKEQSDLKSVQDQNMLTVMIRNIACRFTQDEVMSFLDEAGFAGKYDFIYLPLNPQRHANLGYVFVNFTHRDYALDIKNRLSGTVFGKSQSIKLCEITLAHVQSLATLQGMYSAH